MILVVNAGSSSVKVALFDDDLQEVLKGAVTEIGAVGELTLGSFRQPVRASDHAAALGILLAVLRGEDHPPESFRAAAHRVVHGGARLTAATRLTPDVMADIEACVPLAPLHNPGNLAGIRALERLVPDLPQFASFDTAFHATNPEVATAYAIPRELRDRGIRRYGFHGISYQSLVERLDPLPPRLLALHLGNGASLCAILDGRSVATSMGYSPLDGLVMGTRSGSIDGMAVLEIAQLHGVEEAARLLNRNSGLAALTGTSDMAAILARDDAEAHFAVDLFCHWAIRHAGSAIAAMGGLDALAFTGGIGENSALVRDRITEGLAWAGRVPVHVLRAEEERRIAADALALLRG
ncbi:acetate kinase [Rubellimicrobium rubrum]|uniref:Acetate kinase n=1 Tax=Rubellimicrobium rubrum TaxID=2585369 RepID=A0A5C4MZB8_9RHOB|nr:acetate kinase [Rubellimicrobium rubrum]TNC49851.1 acetate kinase [Rubellimicrobium rubrum]